MKPRKDYHRNHSKADELEDVCKPCKAQRDAARRRNRATVSVVSPCPLSLASDQQNISEKGHGNCTDPALQV